ncbi:discoidin domain-containing protein [Catenuloplanes sp. NPDC051500]|uniref:discoidin domain-containing protein n=1 Tax=Catenuloplanes sp. NPDC051500 TaxID=3363959 RepID=UPI003789162A
MAGISAEHGTTPAGDAERADYAADRAHALRTMFPRRVAAVEEPPLSPETPPAPAEDTAAAGEAPFVPPPRLSRKRAWVIVGAGVALILAASAAVLLTATAAPEPADREEQQAGVVVPALTPPAEPTPTPSRSPSPSPSPSASPAPPALSASAPEPAPPQAQPNPGGTNLALGRRVSVSGVEGDPWKASNAVDGDVTTRWSSAFTDTGWLIVDLGESRAISEIDIVWEHAFALTYRVETSTDAKKWSPIFSTTAGAGGTVTVRKPATARYVRLFCTKRNGQYGYSVLEFRVR